MFGEVNFCKPLPLKNYIIKLKIARHISVWLYYYKHLVQSICNTLSLFIMLIYSTQLNI